MSVELNERLDHLRQSGKITPESIDFSMNDPDAVREEFGRTFHYFGRVENEVDSGSLLTMLPRIADGPIKDFIDLWVWQERAHGQDFDYLQTQLGLEPAPPSPYPIEMHNKFAGLVGGMSASLHDVLEMIYLARGGMHERLTYIGYKLMADKLGAMGETALKETMIEPIRRQEGGHLGYYKLAAKELKGNLKPWQLWLARKVSVATYAPVGAGSKEDKPDFGHVAVVLAGESVDTFTEPVQKMAEDLLSEGGEELPKFVAAAINTCIEANRANSGNLQRT